MSITISAESVDGHRERLTADADHYVTLINRSRDRLGTAFEENVESVTTPQFRQEVEAVFADPNLAINVSGLLAVLDALDIVDDYPGFIVDEVLGRQLAVTIADGEPEATLAAATFHVIDAWYDDPTAGAGVDDRDAGIAAGFQVRLPGWAWQESDGPFAGSR